MARAPFNVRIPRTVHASGQSLHQQAAQGMKEIVDGFKEFCDELEQKVTPDVMVEALKPTLDLSNVYAPIDTGEMRSSSYVEAVPRRGGPQAEIGYGKGGLAPYTIFVHEMPHFYHQPPTQYKFLQRAMDEDYYQVLNRIVKGIKQRTGL